MRDPFAKEVARAMRDRLTLLESARRFGTPQYLIDMDALRARAQEFRTTFAGIRPCYACKSNDLPALLDALRKEGFAADVASGFELELARSLGFEEIIFTAPVKTDEELALAAKERAIINVDNREELERVARLGVPCRISLRLRSPGKGAWTKFGFTDVRVPLGIIARKKLLTLEGLHCHMSWNATPRAYVRNLAYLRDIVEKHRLRVRFLDIGGGFLPQESATLVDGRPRADRVRPLAAFADAIRRVRLPQGIEVWVEPGRWISTTSTVLLTKVYARRPGAVIADAGTHLNGDTTFDVTYVPILNLSRKGGRKRATVYGPLCDPHDLWGQTYVGAPARPGHVLAILCQGAYAFSTASRWQRPIAPYVALSKGKLRLVKREERFAERYAGCTENL